MGLIGDFLNAPLPLFISSNKILKLSKVEVYEVASFYDGEWLNGKKNGKGYWSNHHPLLGTISSADAMSPQYVVMDDFEEDEHFYYGFWKNDKKVC